MAVKTKTNKKEKKVSKKAAPPPKPVEEEESSEEEDSDEEMAPVKQVAAEADSSDEESEEESDDGEAPNGNGVASSDKSDDEEEDSDEEECEEAKTTLAAEGSDEESEEESDEEESAEAAKMDESSDDEEEEGSDDEEDSDDEDSDEDEVKPQKRKAAPAKEPKSKKAKRNSDDEEEDSDDESEDEEESDEEESNEAEEKSFFVGSLPIEWGETELRKFFKKNGVNASGVRKREGKPFGHIDTADEAKVMKLNGKEVEGSNIKIDVAGGGKSSGEDKFGEERKRTVCVRNLDFNLAESDIQAHFEGCEKVTVLRNDDGRMRGIAFILYAKESDADQAISELNESTLGERNILCSKASDRPAGGARGRGGRGDFRGGRGDGRGGRGGRGGGPTGAPTKKLFVGNLSFSMNSESLAGYFEGATNVHVMTDRETGQSRGFGFVEFDSVDNAKEAFNGAKGAEIDGRKIRVDFAQDRERSFGGDRGGRGGFGRGRGGDRGRGRGGGFRGGRGRGSFVQGQGKKKTFDDDD